jgi:PAS domain S-box-containing protein
MRRRQPQRRTSRQARRLIAALVVLCLAPLALLTWFSLTLSAKAVRNQVDARVRNTATASAVYVSEQMDGLSDLVDSYAQRPTVVAAMRRPAARRDRRAIAHHLAELQHARTGIEVAFVTDPEGRLVDIVPPTPSILGRDFSFRDWYKGVTSTRRPYVSEAYETAATGHARVVGAAVQIRAPAAGGGRGRVVGILVAAYGLETIQRFVDDFAAAQGVRLTVTDQRGVVVAAAGAARRGLDSRRGDPLVDAALAHRSGISERTTPAGRMITAYEPVAGLDWTVTADVATGTAFAPIGELRRTVLAIGAVLGLALLAGLVLLARALGQRALAEQQVEEGEERTRELLAATAEAFISMDAAGLVTGWNWRAEQTFGWPAAEAVGRPLAELIVPGRSRQAHDQGRRRYLETGQGPLLNRRVEVTALHRDGHQLPVEVVIWAVGSGTATTFNAFAHDITDRRQAEQALKQAKQDAERANRAKSEFLSKMSHELRTPLNAILGFGQLLQLEDLTSEQAESVDHMLNGGRHLLGLINEVLDISRIETDSLSLSPEPVDVMKVVKDTVDLIGPLAAERQIAVEAPDPAGGGRTVRADPQRLKQVLLNLVSNAVKYNRHGGSIRVTCQAAAPGRVAVAVKDSGPGIPPDKMGRLFTPFDRLGAEQSEVQGTGMGLALSKGLVEAMGGSLSAESVEGDGTTFTLELAETAGPAGPHDPTLDPPPPGPAPDPAERHTVLYVEDSPSNLRLVERVLHERGGVRLLTTGRGEEVQELVRRHRPELVLLDLHLPDLDGEEVLGRLKADPATARVPVVVVSVDVSSQKIERALAAGAREYLIKPLDVARFRTVVDSLLSKAPSRR